MFFGLFDKILKWLGYRNEEDFSSVENKLNEIQKEKEQLREKMEKKEDDLTEYERMMKVLDNDSYSRRTLIEKFGGRTKAVLIIFSRQNPPDREADTSFMSQNLERLNAVNLNPKTRIIPPKSVPDELKKDEGIRNWAEKEIYRGHENYRGMVCLNCVIDLKEVSSRTDYDEPGQFDRTIDQAIKLEDIFDEDEFKKYYNKSDISFTDLVMEGDIGFIASFVTYGGNEERIQEDKYEIEEKLGEPNLHDLADKEIQERLSEVLSEHISGDTDRIANDIIETAQLLEEKFYDEK